MDFNVDTQENSLRRIVEALEKVASQLEQVNRELREMKEIMQHDSSMKNT